MCSRDRRGLYVTSHDSRLRSDCRSWTTLHTSLHIRTIRLRGHIGDFSSAVYNELFSKQNFMNILSAIEARAEASPVIYASTCMSQWFLALSLRWLDINLFRNAISQTEIESDLAPLMDISPPCVTGAPLSSVNDARLLPTLAVSRRWLGYYKVCRSDPLRPRYT